MHVADADAGLEHTSGCAETFSRPTDDSGSSDAGSSVSGAVSTKQVPPPRYISATTAAAAGGTAAAVDSFCLYIFLLQVRQVFERFSAASSAAAADARFEFFKLNIWPRLSEGATAGLMMFVPSYFDVVRLR